MSDQLTDQPSSTRRITDAALVIIAFGAIAAWVWRRFRTPLTTDGVGTVANQLPTPADEVGATSGSLPNGAQT